MAKGLVTIQDRARATWTYQYDPAGHLLSVADPQQRITRYSYDVAGRLISTGDPWDVVPERNKDGV